MAVIIAPAGVSAASFHTPTVFADPALPPAILADDIDPSTGNLRSILVGIHPVDSAVITRLRTRRGSGASVSEVGQRFDRVKKVDETILSQLRTEVDVMLQDLVDRRDIRIEQVLSEEDGDTARVFVEYTNLRTQAKPKRIQIA